MTASVPEVRGYPGLNAVRAVAALGVVATHTAFDTGEILNGAHGAFLARLDFGVTLFFVLSGFLLSRPFFLAAAQGRPHPSYRHYLWKRALRILPLYWVAVVIALLTLPENRDLGVSAWLRNLTLTQIYTDGQLPAGLTQMWSLCTEVAFYLLLPLITTVLLTGRRSRGWHPGRVLLGLAVISVFGYAWQVVAASSSDPTTEHVHQWLPGFMPWFSVGMAFAVVSVQTAGAATSRRRHILDRIGADLVGSWLVALALFTIVCTPIGGPLLLVPPTPLEAGAKSVLYTLSAAFFVLPLVFGPEREGLARRLASSRPAVWLGDISYGIFALHLLMLEVAMRVLDVEEFQGSFGNVFLLTVLGTVVVSAVSYYALERPLLRLKNTGPFAPKPAAPVANASTASS